MNCVDDCSYQSIPLNVGRELQLSELAKDPRGHRFLSDGSSMSHGKYWCMYVPPGFGSALIIQANI